MSRLIPPILLLCVACAALRPSNTPAPVLVHSSNQSVVDVYLLCGDQDAEWLGAVQSRGAAAYEIPVKRLRCAAGLNFFLVDHASGRGYWVGPMYPDTWSVVQLSIEEYAGLSTAHVRRAPR